jgi:hypothetical protein
MTCPNDCGACTCVGATANCDGNWVNGCECGSTGCCGASCETTHSNGLGYSYADCGALGTPGVANTYSATMASAARGAWPFGGADSMGTCGMGANGSDCLARQTASSCAVWCYTKSLAGFVHLDTASTACQCPTIADPTWN